MKSYFVLTSVLWMSQLYGQDPKPNEPTQVVEVELEVLQKQEQMVNGKKITTMEVVPPTAANFTTVIRSASPDESGPQPPVSPIPAPSVGLPGQFLHLISDTYDGRFSKLSWNHQGQQYEAWSNLDFTLLSGFTNFRSKGKNVTFMHMCSNRTTATGEDSLPEGSPRWLKKWPSAAEKPKFRITKGDKENKEAIHPIRTLHRLYAKEHRALIQSKAERVEYFEKVAAQRKAKSEEDIEIYYWRKKTDLNAQNNGKEAK